MRVTRDTDLRLAYDRPDDWWARARWDHAHMDQAERVEQGTRNLKLIGVIMLATILIGLFSALAIVGGSVWFAIATFTYLFGRKP